jgi:hypothetical protein
MSVPQLRDADNDEIVNIGDSIFALSGDIYDELHAKAGETWRHYALSGVQMIGGEILGPPIPTQYEIAKSDDPDIRTVYMDGGGNDILLAALLFDPHDCKNCNEWWCGDLSQSCKDLVDDVYVETVNLFNRMDSDGVEQVVVLGYYHLKWGIFGDLTKLNDATDYGDQKFQEACNNSTANAVFIDPRDAFAGHEGSYIISDGIHPTLEGSRVLADLIWEEIDHH